MPAGVVDIKRNGLHLLRDLDQPAELGLVDHAAADALGRDLGLLRDDARGELFGRHLQREEADDPAIDRLTLPSASVSVRCARATLKAILVASAVLPIDGRPGEDHEIGLLQAAHRAVEIMQAGRQAGQVPVALIGVGGHLDGVGERGREAMKPEPYLPFSASSNSRCSASSICACGGMSTGES